MNKTVTFIIVLICFSCCPKIQQEDLYYYKQKNIKIYTNLLLLNKVYVAKRDSNNKYYHLVFYKNGIFEYSLLNKSIESILNQEKMKRNGLYKIEGNMIYTESYGSCGTSFFFHKYIIKSDGKLEYLGYTKRITHQLIFGLEPSYKILSGEPMIYELFRDSNNQTLNFELDTNNLYFGDR